MDKYVTLAKVVNLKDHASIPYKFIKPIYDQKRTHAVVIYSPDNDLIRIFFTGDSEIFKLKAQVDGHGYEFLGSLGGFLGAFELTPLYTSFCSKKPCVYEGYFEKSTLKISLEEFRKQFLKLKGVSDAKITQIR